MSKLFMLFHGRFPSEKAASLFAAKSAASFAQQGMEVTLIIPRRLEREKGDPYVWYGVEKNFRIVPLPVIDLYFLPLPYSLAFWVSFVSFSVSSFLYLFFMARRSNLIYSNESLPLFMASFAFNRTVYEMHDFPESKLVFFGFFLRRMKRVIIHNKWKTKEAIKRFSLMSERILCEPNAVDLGDFDIGESKKDVRRKLGLPQEMNIVAYTGHLYSWKGVDTLAEAARLLPESYLVVFVGGITDDIARFREKYKDDSRILIVGWKPHVEIPLWQKAADVLVLPNTAKKEISKHYTSPMKLFEYAASKRPIVASRIPSITELVGDAEVLLVQPDDPVVLAQAIQKACQGGVSSQNISKSAYSWVRNHTWEKRAQRILRFINQ